MTNEQKAGCVDVLREMLEGARHGVENWERYGTLLAADDLANARKRVAALEYALEAAALSPARSGEAECHDCMELIGERDYREEVIDKILCEVLGPDRHEWSSAYGYADAILDVQERIRALGVIAPRNESSGVSPGGGEEKYAMAANTGPLAAAALLSAELEATPAPQDSVRVGDSLAIEQDVLLELADRLQKARRVPQTAADNRISPTQTLTTPAPAAAADGECPMCPVEIRNLAAVAHNFVVNVEKLGRQGDIAELRRAVERVQPLSDRHFANRAHSHPNPGEPRAPISDGAGQSAGGG